MQLGPGARTGPENNQPHRFAAVAECHHEQACPPVLSALRVPHHGPGAVIDLGFFSCSRADDSGSLGCLRSPEFANETFYGLIAAAIAALDKLLPDRHGIASLAEAKLDGLTVGLTGTVGSLRTGRIQSQT